MSGIGFKEMFEFNFTINNVICSLSLKVHIIKMEGQVGMEMMPTFKIGERGVRMIRRDKGGEPHEFSLEGEEEFGEESRLTALLSWMMMRMLNGGREGGAG